jgi:RecJ-like exonuclease
MTTICYAATHGDYSDFCVAAVFSTREKADAWMATKNETKKCHTCGGVGKMQEMVNRQLSSGECDDFKRNFAEGKFCMMINGQAATVEQALSMAMVRGMTGRIVPCDRCDGSGTVVENEYEIYKYDLDPEPEEVTP